MRIDPQFLTLAAKIQESSLAMCHEDIRTRLSDAIRAANKDTDRWCYIVAVFGDDKAGDVVYSCNSDLKKAPYTMTTGGATIDVSKAVDVCPLTTYELETVQVGEAGARNSKRDLMQLQTIHDAAAGMGANCSMKESARGGAGIGGGGNLKLTETTPWAEELLLSESIASGVEREIRIIVPCKGSSAVYTEAALQRSAKAFVAGTQMFVNHATRAEEAQRPEGDWRKLVGQLTSAAQWNESHKNGAGLYAKAKFVSSAAPEIIEKASMSGVSIRANGTQAMEAGRPVVKDGLPVLHEITSVESIDIVTKAGAGGMILTESARVANNSNEGVQFEMTEAEVTTLKESLASQTAINQRLLARALRADAMELGAAVLATTSLTEAQRGYVLSQVVGTAEAPRAIAVKESGDLDAVKLTEAINAQAKAYAQTLPAGRVTGMGPGAPVQVTESAEQKTAREARDRELLQQDLVTMQELGLTESAAKTTLGIRLVA